MKSLDKNIFNGLFLELGGDIYQSRCSYFKDKIHTAHVIFNEPGVIVDNEIFEKLLEKGYRRSGLIFYKSICPDCQGCIPIRINVSDFNPSKSQRKVFKKNSHVRILSEENNSSVLKYEIMKKYMEVKHGNTSLNYSSFDSNYCSSCVETKDFLYYYEDNLRAVGIVDLTDNCISTVYFYFDPDIKKFSPGVFSVLKEIEFCKTTAREDYYLGYFIKNHTKMDYKANFKPYELLINGKWKKCHS